MCECVTYKLEAAADGGLDVGAAERCDLAELPGDLDGVVQEEAQATLVAETRRAGDLSEQDWRMEREEKDEGTGRDAKKKEEKEWKERMMDEDRQGENKMSVQ